MARLTISVRNFKSNNQFKTLLKDITPMLKDVLRYGAGYSLEINQDATIYTAKRLNQLSTSLYITTYDTNTAIKIMHAIIEMKNSHPKMAQLSVTLVG